MRISSRILSVTAILGLCCTVRADDVTLRVEKLLAAGIEPAGVHEQLLTLGTAGEAALWTLYADANKSRVVRLRALSELANFATPRTVQGFTNILRSAPRDPLQSSPLVLRRALDGLNTIAETISINLEANDLAPWLNHTDAHVRKSAARLLALVDRGDVDSALSALVAKDPSRMVRATAQRSQTTRAARLR